MDRFNKFILMVVFFLILFGCHNRSEIESHFYTIIHTLDENKVSNFKLAEDDMILVKMPIDSISIISLLDDPILDKYFSNLGVTTDLEFKYYFYIFGFYQFLNAGIVDSEKVRIKLDHLFGNMASERTLLEMKYEKNIIDIVLKNNKCVVKVTL